MAALSLAAAVVFVKLTVALLAIHSDSIGAVSPVEMLQSEPQQQEQSKSVFVVADWGGIGSSPFVTPYEVTAAKSMNNLASRLPNGVEAVFALGDNFYSNGVRSVEDKRFQVTFEAVFNGTRLLPTPWYVVAGNHDWRGNVSAQILYSKRSSRWKFPDYFHTKIIKLNGDSDCAAFILVDTVLLSKSAAALLPDFHRGRPGDSIGKRPSLTDVSVDKYYSWLEEQLATYYHCSYLFVAGHHPVWSIGHHGPTPDLVEHLNPLLLKYKVSAYLCGHEHNMQHIVLNGTDYFVAGAAAHVTVSTEHKHLFPEDSIRYYWNKASDLDGAFMLISFGSDHANASFYEAGPMSKLLYEVRLPRRSVAGNRAAWHDVL